MPLYRICQYNVFIEFVNTMVVSIRDRFTYCGYQNVYLLIAAVILLGNGANGDVGKRSLRSGRCAAAPPKTGFAFPRLQLGL